MSINKSSFDAVISPSKAFSRFFDFFLYEFRFFLSMYSLPQEPLIDVPEQQK